MIRANLIAVLVLGLACGTAAGDVIQIAPGQMAVMDGAVYVSFGTEGMRQGPGLYVSEAFLTFKPSGLHKGDYQFEARELLSPWTSAAIPGAIAPEESDEELALWNISEFNFDRGAADLVRLDLKPALEKWLKTGSNFGVVVRCVSEGGLGQASLQDAQLIVRYGFLGFPWSE